MAGKHSRWKKGNERYPSGSGNRDKYREQPGWRKGAKVRKWTEKRK